jgi:hypothetical protein
VRIQTGLRKDYSHPRVENFQGGMKWSLYQCVVNADSCRSFHVLLAALANCPILVLIDS